MNVHLKLIILHLDLQTMANGCLVDEGHIISRPLLCSDIGSGLRDILLDYLEIKPEWVKFNLVDVLYDESNIEIVYTCLIPAIIKNIKGQWIPLGTINDQENKRLVFQASQKVFAG